MNYKVDSVALRKAMIDNGINSISELSKQSGVNRNTLSDVLRGKIQPSSNVMFKLVDTLKIDPVSAGNIFFS